MLLERALAAGSRPGRGRRRRRRLWRGCGGGGGRLEQRAAPLHRLALVLALGALEPLARQLQRRRAAARDGADERAAAEEELDAVVEAALRAKVQRCVARPLRLPVADALHHCAAPDGVEVREQDAHRMDVAVAGREHERRAAGPALRRPVRLGVHPEQLAQHAVRAAVDGPVHGARQVGSHLGECEEAADEVVCGGVLDRAHAERRRVARVDLRDAREQLDALAPALGVPGHRVLRPGSPVQRREALRVDVRRARALLHEPQHGRGVTRVRRVAQQLVLPLLPERPVLLEHGRSEAVQQPDV